MPKEEIHGYLRTAILLAGIIFACGGYAMKINDNSNKANKAIDKVELVDERVHAIEKNQERDIALKESMVGTLSRLENKIDAMNVDQNTMKGDLREAKVKLETLTRD